MNAKYVLRNGVRMMVSAGPGSVHRPIPSIDGFHVVNYAGLYVAAITPHTEKIVWTDNEREALKLDGFMASVVAGSLTWNQKTLSDSFPCS